MSLPREWSLQDSVERDTVACATASQEMVGATVIDENMNQQNQLGSLLSIHSAPVFDLSNGVPSPKRPASLAVQATATSTPIVPPHLQSPETIEDEDNDNLLTISSLTARPLIAKSRELRSTKCSSAKKRKPRRYETKKPRNITYVPLDGGYGWVIVFGAFFVQFWVAGLVKSYGVLYVEVMETFKDATASVASWIPAILSCLCLALAPVTSMLCQKYSCRTVVFIGGLFCALGLTISYFATSLVHLFFTFGVLTGIGGGLSTTPGIIIVSQYFDKHRALANGICVSGTAAGSFVFPLLIEVLVDKFGFHGTILLLGGCMLHVCVSATLYRPLENNYAPEDVAQVSVKTEKIEIATTKGLGTTKQQKLDLLFANDATTKHNLLNELFHQNGVVAVELTDSEEEKDVIGECLRMKPISKIRSSSLLHSVEDLSTDSTCVYKARSSLRSLRSSVTAVCAPPQTEPPAQEGPKTIVQKIMKYIDLSLLKNPQFIMMCLSVSLMSTGSPYMLYYLPAYVHAAGYTKSEAGYLVAISAALDLCGRLGLGWLSDLQLFDRRKGYIGSVVGAGVAVLAIPMAHSFYVLACSVGMYGLCLGCWFLLVPVLLADQYGTDKISSTYGLVRMFQSVGAISIPPLAGYLRDVTGSYTVCFLCMGTCMVMGGLPLLLVFNEVSKSSKITVNAENGNTQGEATVKE
ncbi:monocarboxylate transporter 12 isoform X1 [Hylaeus anthracinus]|uniref:monocarboxylate transporter 12 isoform X1 n=1 Tax=Hylaeus volcanicus TaxID=313075 RepID=UPI0023B87959|nr:monocarboxylate transporter 12 isoform X1 [Hylaeus volcanicus]XP_053988173.1 monocarboxylate transporter 12 isoform X1 [Hylaeus volcanicus]XP_054008582.1 monocarboxylate transporter 12 isoform X1 [Hylaeus anthracinus]XP_054008584.1 monocarboxylate transporter 12 isoform X1 [Hylaeus anthracinus]